jgi:leucyl aminopeptidase
MTDFVRLPEGDSPSHTHVILWHSAEALNTWLKEYTNISNVRNWESSKPSTRIYETGNELYVFARLESVELEPGNLEKARLAGSAVCAELKKYEAQTAEALALDMPEDVFFCFLEGLALAAYSFDVYRTRNGSKPLEYITANHPRIPELNSIIRLTWMARDLVNEPYEKLTAVEYSRRMETEAQKRGVRCKVMHKEEIESLSMGGVLGVNAGSEDPPTFTILEWKPENHRNTKPIVLVGKGVVFDTGGLSLKPTANSMDIMKCDMGGSAILFAAILAAAENNLPLHIITLIPATDNRPGKNAITPGGILHMHNGLTVEVMNTDAEGRLILADAMSYAETYEPEVLIEASTLTGSAAMAIGKYGIVAMGTAAKDMERLKEAGTSVYERIVEFPFWEEFDAELKSDIADLKNIGGREAGAITAGKFLANFTTAPYIHLDIAGPSFNSAPDGYRPKNGTGYGFRLMYEYLKNRANG